MASNFSDGPRLASNKKHLFSFKEPAAVAPSRRATMFWPDVHNVIAAATEPPRKSDNLTEVVQWDNYTLFVNDQRIFVHSGEFHPFRLPVPDLWLDIFQKMVAAGLNTASRALSNPAPGVLDFDEWRELQPVLDAAKLAGIWIILRPGMSIRENLPIFLYPFPQSRPSISQINAETTAGGIALWATSRTSSEFRTNATDFEDAWTPYIAQVASYVVPNQVSNNGPILDNEYSQNPIERAEYFAQLEAAYRQDGVVIPLTYNDPGEGRNFVNGTGAVDIYGLDSYPQGFDCSHPEQWNPVTTNYHQYHEEVNPGQPWYIPEFQGGSFDPWGGPGFDACEILTGADFQDVFNKWNWASNVKLISYYMLYGGTNWGGLPEPGVYTSYDYGSSIRESRAIGSKFDELKRQGIFLRSTPNFRKTDWVGDTSSTIPGVTVNGSEAYVTFLRNPDTGTGFFLVRQANSSSTANISYQITVPTSEGTFTLPTTYSALTLYGRQSRVYVTDYTFGSSPNSHVLWSTASVFYAGTIGSRDVLFLYGDADQYAETIVMLTGNSSQAQSADVTYAPSSVSGHTSVTFLPGITGLVTVWDSDTQLVLFSDPVTAATFWAPPIVTDASAPFANYFQFGTNETVLVGGPYLVRNASIAGGTLALRGDLNASATLTVVAPPAVTAVTWNGAPVDTMVQGAAAGGVLTGSLEMTLSASSLGVPALGAWRYADSLPEVQPGFSDADWVEANHTATNITAMLYGDGRVLYGGCENEVLWRGHFTGTGSESAVNLTINGGTAFAGSVWINNYFINSTWSSSSEQTTRYDNVITVIQPNVCAHEPPLERSPRGIPGFQLNSGNFTSWKVQGKLGGYTEYPDKTRGLLNEGGFYAERAGWHLPGFDTSSWTARNLSEGLPSGSAGVGFFVTTFDLALPAGTDTLMSFQFDTSDQPYRALLFVNGWNYGKRVANIGPQTKYPVPQGILDYNGTNTLAVALWALEDTPVSPTLDLVVDYVLEGGVGSIAVNNPPYSARSVA
ncbi:glycoside hydrolase superfamily [Amylocystis lapponica]|nr:glycoside hydrolase superfamily [Amylocystis lapponica]